MATGLTILEACSTVFEFFTKILDFFVGSIRNPQNPTEQFIGDKINEFFAQRAGSGEVFT